MNQYDVAVTPSPYVVTSLITNVQIRVINLSLFTSVSVSAILFSDTEFIASKSYLLEGEDYTNWGNNDEYIVDYVLAQLGLTPVGGTPVVVTTA